LDNLIMNRAFEQRGAACQAMERLLSDYADGTLSARETWEVEKHLAACQECTAAARQMQTTIDLLRTSDRFDTGDDFMAKLHTRLDGLDSQSPHSRSPLNGLRDWLAGVGVILRTRRTPALSLGVALAGVAALAVLAQPLWMHPGEVPALDSVRPNFQVQQTLERQVAASASDPLGDAAAERLTAHAGLGEDASGGSLD